MRQKKDSEFKNFHTILIFSAVVGFAIIISLFLKGISLIQSSTFDGEHRYTLFIKQEKPLILSFDPVSDSVSVLEVSKTLDQKEASRYLRIPIDGYVSYKSDKNISTSDLEDGRKISSVFFKVVKDIPVLQTNLTVIDMVRLALSSSSVPSHKIITKSIPGTLDSYLVDSIVSSMFSDTTIADEKTSVSVVNGTSISGLGASFERLLLNIGVNVVSVSTSDSPIKTSYIVYQGDKPPYTLSKMEKILGVSTKKEPKSGISDIIIYLGRDILRKPIF